MKNLTNIAIKAATAVLAVALAASCVFEKENPSLVRGKTKVMLELNVGADDMTTKATPSDDEKAIKTLRVYAYIGDVMVGYANPQTISGAWYMDLNLPESGTYDIDFYAVANEAGLSDVTGSTLSANMSKAELKKIIYKATAANTTMAETGIPMYVMHTEEDVDVAATNGTNTAAGHENHAILDKRVTLRLTRSLSKITFYAAEAVSGTETATTQTPKVKISGVTIKNAKLTSGLFETKTSENTEVEAGPAQPVDVTNTIGLDATSDANTNNIPDVVEDVNNYTAITTPYYIAENNVGSDAWDTSVEGGTYLEVSYLLGTSTEPKTAIVNMPAIERNKHYKVMARIKANGELALTLNVVDWTLGTGATISFDKEVTFDSSKGFKWYKNGVEQNLTIDNETGKPIVYTFSVNAGEQVTCKFKITAPIGGTWRASLSGGDVQNYAFVENETDKITGNIGEDAQITIKTLNSNLNSESDRPVKLIITAVNTDGKSMVVNFSETGYYIINQSQM